MPEKPELRFEITLNFPGEGDLARARPHRVGAGGACQAWLPGPCGERLLLALGSARRPLTPASITRRINRNEGEPVLACNEGGG
jgi:hypothetical protein